MPRVSPYTEQVSAQGHNADFQDPATADAGLGAAARSIGNSVGRLVQQHQQVEDDQGKMWAANATAQNEVQQQKMQADRVNSLDPSAPDYVDQVNSLPETADTDYQASTQALMEAAPNNAARKYVAMHAAGGRVRTMASAIDTSASLNASYSVSQVDQATKSNSDIIAGSPDNGTFDDINGRQRQTIMDLQTINPTVKLKLADQATHALSLTQIQAAAANNPTAFLQSVNAQGGVTTARGVVKGAVPGNPADATAGTAPDGSTAATANPAMLAFANQQLASGKSADDAMTAATQQFKPAAGVAFSLAQDGKSFVDNGVVSNGPTSSDPQVIPLTDDAIAAAKPGLSGWDNLTWQEKVAAVRGAESAAGKSLAEDRGVLTRQLTDAKATMLSGQQYPDIDSPRFSVDNLKRVFGDDVGAREAADLQNSAQVGQFAKMAATMPVAQRQATLQHLAPAPGDGFAAANQTYQVALRANAQVSEQQQKAPIQSAINAGIASAQPLDFSQQDTLGSQLSARTAVAATMVRDYGTKAQIFTDPEVQQLSSMLGNQSGKDRIATLANIRIGLNDPKSFGVAMDQLAPKNPTLAYAANLAAKDGVAYIDGKATQPADVAVKIADGDIILNGRNLDKQMAKGDDPSMPNGSKAVSFDDTTFKQLFSTALGGAFRTPDAQRSAATEQETYNAVKAYYVADAYQQGKPLNVIDQKDMNRAIQAVVGRPWQGVGGGGTLLAPYGVPMDQFQNQWEPRAKAALKAAGYDDTSSEQIMDKAVPINLADGKYGFQQGTRLQTDRAGRPIVIDYAQPFVSQTAAPAPAPASLPMMHRN